MRDDRSDTRAVRGVYLVVLVIPLVLVAGLWIVQGVDDPFRRAAFAAVVTVHGLLLLGVANGRLSLRAAGPWVVLSPSAILVSRLLVWEASPSSRPDDVGLLIAALAWFGMLFALAFLVFDTRRRTVVSLCSYVLVYLGAGWSAREGITVTASFGVATLAVGDDARALMRRADLALYAARSDGRDRVAGVGDPPSR